MRDYLLQGKHGNSCLKIINNPQQHLIYAVYERKNMARKKVEKIVSVEMIRSKIYLIRGKKVMLDRDLAELYGVQTGAFNQAVKRKRNRFPDDFMFSLTREEIMNLSQLVISSKIKHAPNVNVFTEQGIAMLSGVLNSTRAVNVNIHIMRTFVQMREMVVIQKEIFQRLNKIEIKQLKNDGEIVRIVEMIKAILELPITLKRKSKPIGFKFPEKL